MSDFLSALGNLNEAKDGVYRLKRQIRTLECERENLIAETLRWAEADKKSKEEMGKLSHVVTAVQKWFNEHRPTCAEAFSQSDSVNLALPELGEACFEALVRVGMYE